MERSASGGTATLGEFADAMKRRWWLLAVGALLGLALGAAYLFVAPKTYIATATVLVNPVGEFFDNTVDGARTNSGINLDTEAQLVRSQAVSSVAQAKIGTDEKVGQLVQRVTVTVPPNTNVLRISFTAATKEKAAAGAAAYAEAYLENRRASAEEFNAALVGTLRQRVTTLEKKSELADRVQLENILGEINAINLRLSDIITAITPGTIISDPLPPNRPASPNQLLVLFSGLAFGLLMGLLGVAASERRDGRIYDWRIVERRLDLPVLANVPGKSRAAPELLPAAPVMDQA